MLPFAVVCLLEMRRTRSSEALGWLRDSFLTTQTWCEAQLHQFLSWLEAEEYPHSAQKNFFELVWCEFHQNRRFIHDRRHQDVHNLSLETNTSQRGEVWQPTSRRATRRSHRPPTPPTEKVGSTTLLQMSPDRDPSSQTVLQITNNFGQHGSGCNSGRRQRPWRQGITRQHLQRKAHQLRKCQQQDFRIQSPELKVWQEKSPTRQERTHKCVAVVAWERMPKDPMRTCGSTCMNTIFWRVGRITPNGENNQLPC